MFSTKIPDVLYDILLFIVIILLELKRFNNYTYMFLFPVLLFHHYIIVINRDPTFKIR